MSRLVNPSFIRITAPEQGQLLEAIKVGAWPQGTTPGSHPNDPIAVVEVVPTDEAGDSCHATLATLLPLLPDGVEVDIWVAGVNEGVQGPWVKGDDTVVAAATPNITVADVQ